MTLPQSRRPGPWLPRWSAPRPFKEFSPRQKCILLRQNCIQWPLKSPLSNIEPPALDYDETAAPAQHRTRCAAARLQETESISMLCCWYYLGLMTHSGLMRRTLNNKNTRAQQLVATVRYSRIEREAKRGLDPDSVPTLSLYWKVPCGCGAGAGVTSRVFTKLRGRPQLTRGGLHPSNQQGHCAQTVELQTKVHTDKAATGQGVAGTQQFLQHSGGGGSNEWIWAGSGHMCQRNYRIINRL